MMCNEDSQGGLRSAEWIPGWEYPLQKSFARAKPDKPKTAPVTALMNVIFGQVSRALAGGAMGPEAFTVLLALLSTHFDHTNT